MPAVQVPAPAPDWPPRWPVYPKDPNDVAGHAMYLARCMGRHAAAGQQDLYAMCEAQLAALIEEYLPCPKCQARREADEQAEERRSRRSEAEIARRE